jgi:general stress protein YciG
MGKKGTTGKARRGFAAMDPEKQRAIASMGGKTSQAHGTAHRYTLEEAREAGRKGGRAAQGRGPANRFTSKTGKVASAKRWRGKRKNQEGEPGGPGGESGYPLGLRRGRMRPAQPWTP